MKQVILDTLDNIANDQINLASKAARIKIADLLIEAFKKVDKKGK
jgi:hypothetical protein